MNSAKTTDTGETHTVPKIKMSEIKLKMMMCPAVILANKRTIKANGLVKILSISTGIIIGAKKGDTPGVAKICFQ